MMNDNGPRCGIDEPYTGPVKTKLYRYGFIDGVRTLKDSQLAQLFETAKEQSILELAMYSEDLKRWSAKTFVEFFKKEDKILWLIFYENKLGGWVWLDDFGRKTARVHFCLFKWLGKARLTTRVGRETLWQLFNWKFNNGATLHVIRGETPAFNKLAVRFCQRVGLKIVGEIPFAAYRYAEGTSYAMVYSFVTKDMLNSYIGHPCAEEDANEKEGDKPGEAEPEAKQRA